MLSRCAIDFYMFGSDSECVSFSRDCEAIAVPLGDAITIPEGTVGAITQALGGSFTVYVSGNLYRIAGRDADAIGKAPTKAPELPPDASDEDVTRLVWEQMRTCFDPEIPVNIVDLGLIYDCRVANHEDGTRSIEIEMTLTAPGCGMGDILVDDVASKIEMIPTVKKVDVDLVFDPPWSFEMMSYEAKLETGML